MRIPLETDPTYEPEAGFAGREACGSALPAGD
jgi:hypothetical protein